MQKKLKVLVLSDHALSTSGVGTQTRHLLNGLIEKGCWTFRQFGAALKHTDYKTVVVNDDFIIKPIDGFGNPELIRVTLATEKPDLLFIFTDPRFFVWLFEMEDEIHQICPIVWWHVWDNYPYPKFNESFYEATDLLNCHSHMTYEMLKGKFPEKTNWVPHSIPDNIFFPIPENEIQNYKIQLLGEDRKDHFVGIWVNRNAKRKRPNDILESWSMFMKELGRKKGHQKATLIMHTEPTDSEGPNLYKTAEALNIQSSVFFSRDRLEFEKMNILYNISDFCLNMSYAEGFGLSTLESMMTGTPIIAAKTGGLTKQVWNSKTKKANGVALDIDVKSLVGSQTVPYIYEDYVSNQNVSKAIFKLYKMSPKEKLRLSKQVLRYAKETFGHQKTVDLWHDTMIDTLNKFKNNNKKWNLIEV
jgi:glycosyltransferase involved in cell wall biosynthesis